VSFQTRSVFRCIKYPRPKTASLPYTRALGIPYTVLEPATLYRVTITTDFSTPNTRKLLPCTRSNSAALYTTVPSYPVPRHLPAILSCFLSRPLVNCYPKHRREAEISSELYHAQHPRTATLHRPSPAQPSRHLDSAKSARTLP
jgi:hypothetical protein